MKVENGEEFTVMRNLNNNDKVPLINPQNNELVPDARIIFEEWFDTFAVPREDFDDAVLEVLRLQEFAIRLPNGLV